MTTTTDKSSARENKFLSRNDKDFSVFLENSSTEDIALMYATIDILKDFCQGLNKEEAKDRRLKLADKVGELEIVRANQILGSFAYGDRVYVKKACRNGVFCGIQESNVPQAWVRYEDSSLPVPASAVDLVKMPAWGEGDRVFWENGSEIKYGDVSQQHWNTSNIKFLDGSEMLVYHDTHSACLKPGDEGLVPVDLSKICLLVENYEYVVEREKEIVESRFGLKIGDRVKVIEASYQPSEEGVITDIVPGIQFWPYSQESLFWVQTDSGRERAKLKHDDFVKVSASLKDENKDNLELLDLLLSSGSTESKFPVPESLVSGIKGKNDWIVLHSGQALNSDYYEVSWSQESKQEAPAVLPAFPQNWDIPEDLQGKELTKQEVFDLISQINSYTAGVEKLAKFTNNFTRYALLKIDLRQGWKNFGHSSMSDFLVRNNELFSKGYSTLQKEWQAARLEFSMKLRIGTLPETHCRELLALSAEPEKCLAALEVASCIAGEQKPTSEHVREGVSKILGRKPSPKKIKTKCGWVAGPNAARHYQVKIYDNEIILHDSYTTTAQTLEQISASTMQPPEQIMVAGLIKTLAHKLGTTNAGAIAAAVDFLHSTQNVEESLAEAA